MLPFVAASVHEKLKEPIPANDGASYFDVGLDSFISSHSEFIPL